MIETVSELRFPIIRQWISFFGAKYSDTRIAKNVGTFSRLEVTQMIIIVGIGGNRFERGFFSIMYLDYKHTNNETIRQS